MALGKALSDKQRPQLDGAWHSGGLLSPEPSPTLLPKNRTKHTDPVFRAPLIFQYFCPHQTAFF